jgi:AcrR family transcriptional regulator
VPGEKRERTRRRLIDAAFEVVAERGFHAATVDLIAGRAGMSTGALYANFETKDDLLFAAFEEHLRWFTESLEAAAAADDVGAGISDWIRALGREPGQFLVFLEFWGYASRRPELREALAERLDEMHAQLTGAIERRAQQDGGAMALPPELAAQVALALGRGLAFDVVTDPGRVDDRRIGELLAALVAPTRPA